MSELIPPKLFYLASPYSHDDPQVVTWRYEKLKTVVANLVDQNFFIFSPILHWHPVAVDHKLPTSFEFWQSYNFHMIDVCDAMFVLQLPGWDTSIGVQAEIEYCRSKDKLTFPLDV
jgi:hypothetical protein